MPVFDGYCNNESCPASGSPVEFRVSSWSSPNPECPRCGRSVFRKIGAPKAIWLKTLGEYDSAYARKNGISQTGDGHYVYETDDSGKTVSTYITTRKEQLEYCKRAGVLDPAEIPGDYGLTNKHAAEQKEHGNSRPTWI